MPKQTSYARVVSGEIPILLDYDFNAYRAKYTDKGNVEFVIPLRRHGGVSLRDEPGQERPEHGQGKKVLDYRAVRQGPGDLGQRLSAPGRAPIELPDGGRRRKFLPDSEYARAKASTGAKMAEVQKGFVDRYLTEVR